MKGVLRGRGWMAFGDSRRERESGETTREKEDVKDGFPYGLESLHKAVSPL
jgi:hypothetical protein